MTNYTLQDFDFELPKELIAQEPVHPRESAKLLEINNDKITEYRVSDLVSLISSKDLIVINNTKVIKSRLIAKRHKSTFIVTLHKPLLNNEWLAFVTKSKRLQKGDSLNITTEASLTILNKKPTGEIKVKFNNVDNILAFLEKNGYIPLPPYIKREEINNQDDASNYQTIFAKKEGAVAAPTASLHFTENLLSQLKQKQVTITEVTLHVGAGTFLPVKVDNIAEHAMHHEYGEVSQETLELIKKTKQNGGRVIAVGTTSLRILEHIAKLEQEGIKITNGYKGETNIFIYPPYKFKTVDALITNFHTPKSTLFMLVCAFAGINNVKKAYNFAVEHNYRFFSYGDCTFLHKKDL
ncbi:tRNA preQ1(34) S-adenosylmethionine ribosyltransferase-isomerase QueA [Rickettsiales bacterium LUAb2]